MTGWSIDFAPVFSPRKTAPSGCVFDFRKSEREAFGRWLRAHRPDALVTLHAEVKGVAGKSADPALRELALVHLDRQESMSDWAGMDQNNFCVGATATDMVVGMLHRNELGVPAFPRAILLPSKWVPGPTASPAKKKKPRTKRGFSGTTLPPTKIRRADDGQKTRLQADLGPRTKRRSKAPARR